MSRRTHGRTLCQLPGCGLEFDRRTPWQTYCTVAHLREADRLAYALGRAALSALIKEAQPKSTAA